MKQIGKYMLVALTGLSVLACNKNEEIVPQDENTPPTAKEFTYTIAVAGDTKSHIDGDHMKWDDGDQIGWFVNNDAFNCSEIDEEADPCTFEISSASALPAHSTVYAFAPCYPLVYESTPTKTAAPLSIPVLQNGTITDAMPMVSVPIEIADAVPASTDKPIAEAKFINLGAVIEYNVYTTNASYNTEKVQSVTFTSDSAIAGDFTVNLTTVAENNIPAPSGIDKQEVISTLASATTVATSKGAGIKVYQVVAPGTHSGTITVTTDGATYAYSISATAFDRATIKTVNVDLASANATRVDARESLLAGKAWKITAFGEYYGEKYPVAKGASLYADDTITFNADHTITYNIQNGIFYWDSSETVGYAWTPAGTERWALELKADGLYLTLSGGAIPLMAVSMTDAVNGSFKIMSLTEDTLSLYMVITEWDNYQTYADFGLAADTSAEEALITGTTWKINEFGEYYDAKSPDHRFDSIFEDDAITFNADHTITYNIQNGIFYWDNSASEGYAWTPTGSERWALELKADGLYLTLSGGAIPLMMVSQTDAVNGSFKILSLTDSLLSIYMPVTEWGGYCAYIDFTPN